MRLAFSNIAWDVAEDDAVAHLLRSYSVDAIDIAPGKYFSDPARASDADVAAVKSWWHERGFEITGMQALLFGTEGLNVFGSSESQANLLQHLTSICRIGAGLAAQYLVFGSPKNRDRSALADEETLSTAVSFFRRLGNIAQDQGVTICLEPNPACYGANFMLTGNETAHVVECVAHPAIKMQFDSGALTINGENAEKLLARSALLTGHIHASEPQLLPLGDCNTNHREIHISLEKFLPRHVVSIEMLATKDEPHLSSIRRALDVAVSAYRPQTRHAP